MYYNFLNISSQFFYLKKCTSDILRFLTVGLARTCKHEGRDARRVVIAHILNMACWSQISLNLIT